ncbi:MAG: substrate-binding domain-containing protein [Planctomycetota bacterium]
MPKGLHQTRHFEVSQQLRSLVAELRGGDLPTKRELMQRFDASQATVDQAVNRLRREGLIYRPAGRRRLAIRQLQRPATLRVCLLRPDWPSAVFDHITATVVQHGSKLGWTFEHVTYRSMAEISLQEAAAGSSALVLLTTAEPIPSELNRVLCRPPMPVVVAQDSRPGLAANTVCNDDSQMCRVGVRHLQGLGHRRIGLVLPSCSTGPMQRAMRGWRQAMELAGEHELDELVVDAKTPHGHDSRDATYRAFDRCLAENRAGFTAVYVASSASALAVMRVLWERQVRVPEDMSVVSADGLSGECAYMCPPVTSVDTSSEEFGRAVATLIDEQVQDQKATDGTPLEPRSLWIDGHLNERRSTCSPKSIQ